jgi:hypothetical protein
MQSVFGLFADYENGKAAVEDLLEAGFEQEEMNAILDVEVAKNHLEVDLDRVDVTASEELDGTEGGLDIVLGTERPVAAPGVGEVYAAGKLATILVKAAAAPDTGDMESALIDFNVSPAVAAAYTDGLVEGSLLFWIRASDEKASQAAEILRDHGGAHVASHTGR